MLQCITVRYILKVQALGLSALQKECLVYVSTLCVMLPHISKKKEQ